MPGSQHGTRRSTRTGLLNETSLRSILDRNREATADLRTAVVVSALGPGWLRLRDVCNETTYDVQNSSGRTYAPGSVVFVGSPGGHPGEVVLGGHPPSGSVGSGGFTITTRRSSYEPTLPAPPTPPADPAVRVDLWWGGSQLHAHGVSSEAEVVETFGPFSLDEPASPSTHLRAGACDPEARRIAFPWKVGGSVSIKVLSLDDDAVSELLPNMHGLKSGPSSSEDPMPLSLGFLDGVLWWVIIGYNAAGGGSWEAYAQNESGDEAIAVTALSAGGGPYASAIMDGGVAIGPDTSAARVFAWSGEEVVNTLGQAVTKASTVTVLSPFVVPLEPEYWNGVIPYLGRPWNSFYYPAGQYFGQQALFAADSADSSSCISLNLAGTRLGLYPFSDGGSKYLRSWVLSDAGGGAMDYERADVLIPEQDWAGTSDTPDAVYLLTM